MAETATGRCALVLGLALGALLLLLLAIVLPWAQALVALDEDIAAKSDQLARFQRLGATLPVLRTELDSVRANEDFKAFYFSASTSALAGAALQSRVQEIVNQAEGRLVSTQILPEARGEEPARVRVRAQIQGSTE
ncbi:MAG: general secretion pathway protein GspM, partial [Chromatiaceae bacterium]|nr:general secretion pathway protein GspM [Chromatiaceae bacterium]